MPPAAVMLIIIDAVPAPLRAGVSCGRQTGVEHDVINASSLEFVFVEIELKAWLGRRATQPRREPALT